jgi:hypothetical protein
VTGRLGHPDTSRFPPLRDEHVRTLPAGHAVGRVFFASGPHPSRWNEFRHYGPLSSRFDHHSPPRRAHPNRAICYAAPAVRDVDGAAVSPLDTCLAEVFGPTGVVDSRIHTPCFAVFRLARDLRALDLVDSDWVTAAGATAALTSGPRSLSREWSRAVYRHYTDDPPDGLFYGAANRPRGRSIALYERAVDTLPRRPEALLPLTAPGLAADLDDACTRLGFLLV